MALNGGFTCGALLWIFVLYYGGFTTGRPADWVLPIISNAFSNANGDKEKDIWLDDYKAGYAFTVPFDVEVVRVAIFTLLGIAMNYFVVNTIFEGFQVYFTNFKL